MIKRLKILFGCKGTWFWACEKMKEGQVVYRLRDSGIVYFTYDKGRRKLIASIWWETSTEGHEWGVSMSDIYATDFKLHRIEGQNYPELHKQSQLKTTD
jgi:hypothetical protein